MARGPTSVRHQEAHGECSLDKADFQPGDLVVLGPLVLPEHRGRPAVVTKVGPVCCTVALLDDHRRAALGECWPGLGDLLPDTPKGRVGTRVRVQGLHASGTSWCNGLTGRVSPHPVEGHPCFVRKSGLPGTPVLVFCVELEPGQGARQKRVLLEQRFFNPVEQGILPPPPALSAVGAGKPCQEDEIMVQALTSTTSSTPAGTPPSTLTSWPRRVFNDFYAGFLYGTPLERQWMALSMVTFDLFMAFVALFYIGAPLVLLMVRSVEFFHVGVVSICLLQAATTIFVPKGELLCRGSSTEHDRRIPGLRGLRTARCRLAQVVRGCAQGLSCTWWMWHMTLQVGALHFWQLHAAVQLQAALAAHCRGQLQPRYAFLAAGVVLAVARRGMRRQALSLRTALSKRTLPSWHELWPWTSFGCRHVVSNVEFAQGLFLDLYGSATSPPCGVLLWLHGGGWVCSARGPSALAMSMAGLHGWLVCSCDYRACRAEAGISLQHQLDDIERAVAWLRLHASDYGAEGLPLCLGGVSAGAHLAVLASDRVRPSALVLSSGLLRTGRDTLLRRPTLLHALQNHVLRGSDLTAWETADPVAVLARSTPIPTALLHGTADIVAPVEDSRAARKALDGREGVLYVEIPGGPHGWDFLSSPTVVEVAAALHSFLSKVAFSGSAGTAASTKTIEPAWGA